MKRFAMLVRRELWEHRSLWMTPAIIGVFFVLLVAIFGQVNWSGMPGAHQGRGLSLPGMAEESAWFSLLIGMAGPFFIASSILAMVYLLDCLYAERRDRSILFWRSLPVSDRETVLAKLTTGLVVTPLITWAALSITGFLCALILKLRMTSLPMFGQFFDLQPLQALRAELVLLVTTLLGALWYAPFAGYFLVISAWAKRSIFAWAFVPPVLLSLVERLMFHTSYLWHAIMGGFMEAAMFVLRVGRMFNANLSHYMDRWREQDPGIPPQIHEPLGLAALRDGTHLWIGLAIAAVLVWLAIWLRQRSEDA